MAVSQSRLYPPIPKKKASVAYLLLLALSFVVLPQWHEFVILSCLASCFPLSDTVCDVCVMFVVRRRRGILQLVVYCWRRKQSNG